MGATTSGDAGGSESGSASSCAADIKEAKNGFKAILKLLHAWAAKYPYVQFYLNGHFPDGAILHDGR